MSSRPTLLLRAGAPLALASLAQTLVGTLALAVAGRLGERELAAVGLGSSLYFTVAVFGVGVLLGLEPVVSQAAGRGDRQGIRRAVGDGLLLAAACAGALALVVVALAVLAQGAPELRLYLWGRLPGLLPYLAFVVLRSAAAAESRTRRVLVAASLANLWVLLAGLALASHLGTLGVGLAESSGALVQALVLARGSVRPLFARSVTSLVPLAVMGLPIAVMLSAEYAVFAGLGIVVAVIEPDRLGAHQVAMALLGTLFMLPAGFGAAVAADVGRAVGRADRLAVRESWQIAAGLAFGMGALLGIPLLLAPRVLAGWITSDPPTIAAAAPLVRVAGVVLVADSVQAVLASAARGAGEIRRSLTASAWGHYGVGLPVGLALATVGGQGALGLWIGLGVGLTSIAVLLGLRLGCHAVSPLSGQ